MFLCVYLYVNIKEDSSFLRPGSYFYLEGGTKVTMNFIYFNLAEIKSPYYTALCTHTILQHCTFGVLPQRWFQ